ncbi:copper resistance CopC family protein [Pseudonocardia xinjiangensis]|uniref:copper resistance CopC family protein n=1 Tax=Pseudonocardia xinjiangensis TaxID=75289 RepID=UPI001B7D06C7|nr:copper resistance CopC family protein [Pseudonocardia xinjiangensis]
MTTGVLRGAAVTVLCGLALLLGAGPALAHTRLESSDPADGASLSTAPQRVSLTFNETMQPGFTTLTVVGPDQARYETGDVTANGDTVSIAVRPLGPAGSYQIGYRVVSEDGHPVSGSIGFTLTTAGPGAAAAASPAATAAPAPTSSAPVAAESAPAQPAGDGGAPIWPWIVGAVVLVGGGVFAALRMARG